jgi:hypothetical protein
MVMRMIELMVIMIIVEVFMMILKLKKIANQIGTKFKYEAFLLAVNMIGIASCQETKLFPLNDLTLQFVVNGLA